MRKTSTFVSVLLLLALAAIPPALAQEDADEDAIKSLRQEIQQLTAGQAAMRRQLTEIKSLIQRGGQQARRAPVIPKGAMIDLAGYPFKGQADAPITIVEYSDFQ